MYQYFSARLGGVQVRTWRRLYSSILESDDCTPLSDGAWVLLTILIAAQDDSGWFPWTPTRVRRVTAARPSWDYQLVSEYAEEIVSSGVAQWVDGGVLLVNGAHLNGIPRKDVAPEYYPRDEPVTGLSQARDESVTLEQSRAEKIKSRAEQSREEGEGAARKPRDVPASLDHHHEDSSLENLDLPEWAEPLRSMAISPRQIEDMVRIARDGFEGLNLEQEAILFRNWWPANSGANGKRRKDPVATWRNWLRSEQENPGGRRRPAPGGSANGQGVDYSEATYRMLLGRKNRGATLRPEDEAKLVELEARYGGRRQ